MLDRMVAEGRVTPAKGDLLDLPPPIKLPPGSKTATQILEEQRQERLYKTD